MKATEQLIEEHNGIMLMLKILSKLCDKLERGEPTSAERLESIVDFLSVFADRCHHGKEEDLLFPALEAAGIPRQGGPIGVMLQEHTLGRGYIKGMSEALAQYKSDQSGAAADLSRHARNYIALLTQHIQKENHVLFPMADMHLSAEEQTELLEGFETIERERIGEGKHEEYHALMHRLETLYLKAQ